MTADERLALIQVKIDNAKEHLNRLKGAVRGFIESKPYEVQTKRDQQGRLIYYVSKAQNVPNSFPVITGDIVHNLMSALDHLAFQLFLVGTNGTGEGRHIYFPIDRGVAEYQRNLARRTDGIKPDVTKVFNNIEPYRGGKGHQLWVLQELNNLDKHRLVVTVGSAYQSFNVGAHARGLLLKSLPAGFPTPPKLDLYAQPKDNLCPVEVGDELFIDALDAEPNPEIDFRFNILLKEPGIVEAPLLDLLHQLCDLVGQTTIQFKSCLA